MKTKAILATLLVAAAASADARFAWPYPPKAVSPDEIGHWVVINGNAWPDRAESELTTVGLSGDEPDGLKALPTKGKISRRGTVSLVLRPTIAQEISRFVKYRSSNA